MRFRKQTLAWKIAGAVRHLLVRLRYPGRFSGAIGLVGSGCLLDLHGRPGTITIGGRSLVHDHVELVAKGELRIGDGFCVNDHSRVISHSSVVIGNDVVIARFVSVLDHDHAARYEEGRLSLSGYDSAPVVIGDRVLIGDKVTILKGVTIGSDVVIGANSVVAGHIPPRCVAAGVPARPIRFFDES